MAPAYTYRPRSRTPRVLLAASLFGLAALGIVGVLMAIGIIPSPFGKREIDRTGQVAIPSAAKDIPAYTRITRDEIIDPKTMSINVTWVPRQSVTPEMILDYGTVLGRVLRHDKRAGNVFTERDFLPLGSRAGIAGAVPPGKRAFVLDPEKVHGLPDLRMGDHFDIVSSQIIDEKTKPGASSSGDDSLAVLPATAGGPSKRALSRVIVEDGVLLTRPTKREITVSSPVYPGRPPKTKPIVEITIAIDPAEAVLLTEALAVDAHLTAAARSGQPKDPKDPTRDLLVAVPTLARGIPLYGAVTREHFLDETTRKTYYVYYKPADAPKDAILNIADAMGRVVNNTRRAGSYLTEADFYPKGTPAGIAAGIPEGKRAFNLHIDKVNGLAALKHGDHFDILTTLKIDPKSLPDIKLLGPGLIPFPIKKAKVRVVVSDAVVVLPATMRGLDGKEIKNAEATIAVQPAEVPALSEAIALDAGLFCAARSGKPDKSSDGSIPSKADPQNNDPKMRVIEIIIDGKRTRRVFYENGQPVEELPPEPIAPAKKN